jgi:hypothetical protein
MKAKLVCIALGLGGLVLGTVVIFFAVALALFALDEYTTFEFVDSIGWYASEFLPVLAFVGGLIFGACLFRWYGRRKGIVWEFGPRTRIVAWIVLAMYLLTWALGGPMVQTENAQWAVDEWKKICEDPDRGGLHTGFPSMQTYITFPILPFVVVSYHEYRIWRLGAAGGWDIQLWHVTGVKRLYFLPSWRS